MTRSARLGSLALWMLAPLGFVGCDGGMSTTDTSYPATPASVLEPKAADGPAPTEGTPAATEAQVSESTSPADAVSESDVVTLTPISYDELRNRIAQDPARLVLVDVWSTTCGPCKENFPHVVEMHRKYADQGLKVISLSLDDPQEPEKVAEARQFLQDQKAETTNYLLDEELGVGNEKLDFNTLPAVFLFGPEGQEVQRFTWDDPNHQFTYDEVEQAVEARLQEHPAATPDSR